MFTFDPFLRYTSPMVLNVVVSGFKQLDGTPSQGAYCLLPADRAPSRQRRPTGSGSRLPSALKFSLELGCSNPTRQSSTSLNYTGSSRVLSLDHRLAPRKQHAEPLHVRLVYNVGLIIVGINLCSCHFVLLFLFSLIGRYHTRTTFA